MKNETTYRPATIEFAVTIDETPVPENIGGFETADEALIFMQKNFFSTNQAITVNRFMDNFEKSELRKKYNEILENIMPVIEQLARDAVEEFNDAKKKKEDAIETVNVYTNQAKAIAVEVKRGLVDMQLDELFTWKLPYKGRYYFFTYIDKNIRLVKISDMTESEKTELFSQGKINEEIFENGEASKKIGKKK
jgi:ElaB/YqjD/DUF883 family membrane-anchored ribosome-binding protein